MLVDSAGTDGWHIGEDADPRALQTLRSAGYDLAHSGRQITTEWFIEPGHPDLSLLYHALAAPSVVATRKGTKLAGFPTLEEIETIENYIGGAIFIL